MYGAIFPEILQPSVQRAFLNALQDTTNTKTLHSADGWNLNPSAWDLLYPYSFWPFSALSSC
jgi:hypothetical protein